MRQILFFSFAALLAASATPAIADCTLGARKCGKDGFVYECVLNSYNGRTYWSTQLYEPRCGGSGGSSSSEQSGSIGNWIANHTAPISEAGVLPATLTRWGTCPGSDKESGMDRINEVL